MYVFAGAGLKSYQQTVLGISGLTDSQLDKLIEDETAKAVGGGVLTKNVVIEAAAAAMIKRFATGLSQVSQLSLSGSKQLMEEERKEEVRLKVRRLQQGNLDDTDIIEKYEQFQKQYSETFQEVSSTLDLPAPTFFRGIVKAFKKGEYNLPPLSSIESKRLKTATRSKVEQVLTAVNVVNTCLAMALSADFKSLSDVHKTLKRKVEDPVSPIDGEDCESIFKAVYTSIFHRLAGDLGQNPNAHVAAVLQQQELFSVYENRMKRKLQDISDYENRMKRKLEDISRPKFPRHADTEKSEFCPPATTAEKPELSWGNDPAQKKKGEWCFGCKLHRTQCLEKLKTGRFCPRKETDEKVPSIILSLTLLSWVNQNKFFQVFQVFVQ